MEKEKTAKQQKEKKNQKFKGVVVKNAMDKTVVVEVKRLKEVFKYGKRVLVSKKFKCHDEKNEYQIGDQVIFEECRPISKDKKWRVIKKVNK